MTWFIIAIAALGSYFIIRKKALGFWLWLFADTFFLIKNIVNQTWPEAVIFALYVALAFYGIISWTTYKEHYE